MKSISISNPTITENMECSIIAKRYVSGQSNIEQWKKIKPVTIAIVVLHLSEDISKSIS